MSAKNGYYSDCLLLFQIATIYFALFFFFFCKKKTFCIPWKHITTAVIIIKNKTINSIKPNILLVVNNNINTLKRKIEDDAIEEVLLIILSERKGKTHILLHSPILQKDFILIIKNHHYQSHFNYHPHLQPTEPMIR